MIFNLLINVLKKSSSEGPGLHEIYNLLPKNNSVELGE